MINYYLLIIALLALLILLIKVAVDFLSNTMNQFFDKWAKKTLRYWLPFYALQRLIKEVILKK